MRDGTVRALSRLHTAIFRLTGGAIGGRMVNNDMLLLTTVGRRTGRAHTVPLLYLEDGRRLVVIASWGGRDDDPDWHRNLLANPSVTVRVKGRERRVIARVADGRERAEWWPRIMAAYDGYATYQARTARVIPVVFLEPA